MIKIHFEDGKCVELTVDGIDVRKRVSVIGIRDDAQGMPVVTLSVPGRFVELTGLDPRLGSLIRLPRGDTM